MIHHTSENPRFVIKTLKNCVFRVKIREQLQAGGNLFEHEIYHVSKGAKLSFMFADDAF